MKVRAVVVGAKIKTEIAKRKVVSPRLVRTQRRRIQMRYCRLSSVLILGRSTRY